MLADNFDTSASTTASAGRLESRIYTHVSAAGFSRQHNGDQHATTIYNGMHCAVAVVA